MTPQLTSHTNQGPTKPCADRARGKQKTESRTIEYDTWLQKLFSGLLVMSEWPSKHVQFYHQIKSIKSCISLLFIWSLYNGFCRWYYLAVGRVLYVFGETWILGVRWLLCAVNCGGTHHYTVLMLTPRITVHYRVMLHRSNTNTHRLPTGKSSPSSKVNKNPHELQSTIQDNAY